MTYMPNCDTRNDMVTLKLLMQLASKVFLVSTSLYMWILFLLGLGDPLKLVLLLDGVTVGATLGDVDQLVVGQALGKRLDCGESSVHSHYFFHSYLKPNI